MADTLVADAGQRSHLHLPISALRQFLLWKSGLLPETHFNDIEAAAHALLGLHSARLSSPCIILYARIPDFRLKSLHTAVHVQRRLIKLRCMRGTLHTAPLNIAETLHAATLAQRLQLCLSLYRRLRATPREVTAIKNALQDHVQRQPWGPSELFSLLSRGLPRIHKKYGVELFRAALKELWECGTICYVNSASGFRAERREYGLTTALYPSLNLAQIGEPSHLVELLKLYLKAYGPATIKDAAWWSGTSPGRVQEVMRELHKEIIACKVEGFEAIFYCHAETFEQLVAMRVLRDEAVVFLAHEDSSLKAYYESRKRYVDSKHYHLLFNSIGEARASIVINGMVVGIWWQDSSGAIRWKTFSRLSSHHQSAIAAQSRLLERAIVEYAS